jgi:putative nucleotidyltransferase-like protein
VEFAAAERRRVLDDRADRIWRAVDGLIDRAAGVEALRRHGLQLLAAERWREAGRAVPAQLRHDEQLAAAVALTAPLVLQRVRAAWPGRVAVMKGPEVAALYPLPQRRAYSDLDLLVEDAAEAQNALLAAGFRPVGDPRLYVDIHHLRPLVASGLAVAVEVHDRPKWLDGLEPPATTDLLDNAVPTATGVDGILTLPPREHALLLAIHSWAHVPLARISHLLDVAVMARRADAHELRMLARAWGVERAWVTTTAAVDGLLLDGRRSWPLRSWARNLTRVDERTVLESHLEHWLAAFSALPPRKALGVSARAVSAEARPAPGESWRVKLRRVRRALRSPSVRLSDHRHALIVRDAAADWTPSGKERDS